MSGDRKGQRTLAGDLRYEAMDMLAMVLERLDTNLDVST